MPYYHKLGNIPPKKHTQFEKPNGGFYYEQLLERLDLMEWLRFLTTNSVQHK